MRITPVDTEKNLILVTIINNTKKQEVAKVKEQNERAVEIRLPPVETAQTMNQPAETEEQLAATEREARESIDIHFETALAAFSQHAENQLKAQNVKNASKKRTSAKLTGEREEGKRDQNEIQPENFTPGNGEKKNWIKSDLLYAKANQGG